MTDRRARAPQAPVTCDARGAWRRGLIGALLCTAASVVAAPAAAVEPPSGEAAEVVLHALGFIGIPYRWGGEHPEQGFDCSGFVRYVYRGVTTAELPRTAEEMSRSGRKIERRHLAAGDLVFFNTLGRPYSHVGIYLGDGRFVHAPTERGRVRIDQFNHPYWRTRYNGARRVLGDELRPPSGAPTPIVATAAPTPTEEALAADWQTGPMGDGP